MGALGFEPRQDVGCKPTALPIRAIPPIKQMIDFTNCQ